MTEIVRKDVVKTDAGHHEVVFTAYQKTSLTDDQWREYDIWAATRARALLMSIYPGHSWGVVHDSAQGYCSVGIPLLMGFNNCMFIRLAEGLTVGKIVAAGGEILERYRLSRTRFNLGQVLEAREKHSALLGPWRKVPE